MKLLLVDDEPHILSALRRLLNQGLDKSWEISTAESGAAALEMIQRDPPDIVLTDMRMPRMNGAALLARIHELQPGIVRMVLSGQMDDASAICAVPHAHQFLCKPCPAPELIATLQGAAVLRRLLGDDSIRETVSSLQTLRTATATYTRLRVALAVPNKSLDDIARIASSDPALAAKVLQLANGGFFASGAPATDLREAVFRIGARTLQTLMVSELLIASTPRDPPPESFVEQLRAAATRRAELANRLAPQNKDAPAAALLCDIGRLILAAARPAAFERALAVPGRAHVAEKAEIGVCHAEIGAYLLGLWGLPMVLVNAVAHHHAPSHAGASSVELATLVHVVDAFVSGEELIDDELDAAGTLDRARQWRALLSEAAAA